MSLLVTVNTPDGVVMAADSRLSMTVRDAEKRTQAARVLSDAVEKIMLTPNGIAVGAVDLGAHGPGMPFHQNLRATVAALDAATPSDAAAALYDWMKARETPGRVILHVAGYQPDSALGEAWLVLRGIGEGDGARVGLPPQSGGLLHHGSMTTVQRLFDPVQLLSPQGEPKQRLAQAVIPFAYMTLQDAIDVATFAISTTTRMQRLTGEPETVGGPIDVLTLTPSGPQWIARKELHA